MAAVTIKQSFDNALPLYQNPIGGGDTHISGTTTLNTDPPKFYTAIPHDAWLHLGIQSVNTAGNALGSEHTPLRENAMCHINEGDVARAAALYLLHPINQALSAIPDFAGSIRCLSEQSKNGVRGDIIFDRLRDEERHSFAAVEFKKRGVIDEREFKRAARTVTGASNIAQYAQLAERENGRSFFRGNSVKLMKQASAYAILYRTKYVALFNWDYLVLIRFSRLNTRLSAEELKEDGVGEYCEISMIKESKFMRAALLGFLVEAYHHTPA